MSSQPPPWQSRWAAPPPPAAPWGTRAQWGGAALHAPAADARGGDPGEARLDQAWLRVAGQQGSVPLRPLGIVELLDGAFATIRTRPLVMMVTGAVAAALAAVVSAVPGWLGDSGDWLTGDSSVDAGVSAGLQAVLAALVVTLVAAMLAPSVTDAALGRRRPAAEVRGLWRRRWAALAVWPLVMVVVVLVGALPWALGVALVASGSEGPGDVLVVLGLIGWVLGWMPLVGGRLTVAAPALLTEQLGPVRALTRAWGLTRRSFWRVLWIQLLAWIMSLLALVVLTIPADVVAELVAPDDGTPVSAARTFAADAVEIVGSLAAMSVLLPFLACVLGLVHLDLRLRREGLAVRLLQDLGRTGEGGRP